LSLSWQYRGSSALAVHGRSDTSLDFDGISVLGAGPSSRSWDCACWESLDSAPSNQPASHPAVRGTSTATRAPPNLGSGTWAACLRIAAVTPRQKGAVRGAARQLKSAQPAREAPIQIPSFVVSLRCRAGIGP